MQDVESVFRGYEGNPSWAAAINKLVSIRETAQGITRLAPTAAKTTFCTMIHELVAGLSWLRVHGEVLARTKMCFEDMAKWNTDLRPRIDNVIRTVSASMPE